MALKGVYKNLIAIREKEATVQLAFNRKANSLALDGGALTIFVSGKRIIPPEDDGYPEAAVNLCGVQPPIQPRGEDADVSWSMLALD